MMRFLMFARYGLALGKQRHDAPDFSPQRGFWYRLFHRHQAKGAH